MDDVVGKAGQRSAIGLWDLSSAVLKPSSREEFSFHAMWQHVLVRAMMDDGVSSLGRQNVQRLALGI